MCSVDNANALSMIGREWDEWGKRTERGAAKYTEATRFFGYLTVERPDLLNRLREAESWPVIIDYLRQSGRLDD